MERFLEPDDRRQRFYEALTDFASTLRVALGSSTFYEQTPEERVRRYKDDLKFFHSLRQSTSAALRRSGGLPRVRGEGAQADG